MNAHTADIVRTCSISAVAVPNNNPSKRNWVVRMFAAYISLNSLWQHSLLLGVFVHSGCIRIDCVCVHNHVHTVHA